jgi:hypothetical protein
MVGKKKRSGTGPADDLEGKEANQAQRTIEFIDKALAEIRKRENLETLNIIILGEQFPDDCSRACGTCIKSESPECEGARRRLLVREALDTEFNVSFFEDCDGITMASVDEESILMSDMIDMAIVFPDSFGSVTEMVDFAHNQKILPKMRVFVKERYHPQHGESKSYFRDYLKKFDAKGGYVDYFEDNKQLVRNILNIRLNVLF